MSLHLRSWARAAVMPWSPSSCPPGGGLAPHASSRMMRPMTTRRWLASLDDATVRFEQGLRQLALDLARNELDRLRTIPLAAPGARTVRVPAAASTAPRAASSAVRRRRAAEPTSVTTEPVATEPVATEPAPQAAVATLAPVERVPEAAWPSSAAAVPAVSETPPAPSEREPGDARRERVRRRREERADRRRHRQERARQRRAAATRVEPAVPERPGSLEGGSDAPGGSAIATPRNAA